jgi:phage protein D
VSVDGQKLEPAEDAALARVSVDLNMDLFGQCTLVFNDPKLALINSTKFASGVAIKVEIGFASKLQKVFEGEVVALEPQFRRDLPPSLRVVCQESIHRLALSQMTRSFNDVDDAEILTKIAQEHGLTGDGPTGTKEHILQANVTDAVFLRRLAQKHGNFLRLEGKKLVIGPPPKGADITISPGDGLTKLKVKIKSQQQVSEISVHGWDPKTKKEIVGKAKPQGETGEGAKKHGGGKTLSFAGHEKVPADVATAEAMAKGRLKKMAEGFVTAQGQMIGDPRVVPGGMLQIDKISGGVDGGYRIDQARHEFAKHGYFIDFTCTRITKKTASSKAKEKQAKADAKNGPVQEAEVAEPWKKQANPAAAQQAAVMKKAAKAGSPLVEQCPAAGPAMAKAS